LIDSNVLLDVAKADPVWGAWSRDQLAEGAERAQLAINPIIYAEISGTFATKEEVDHAFPESVYVRLDLPYPAGFLAGKAFRDYRRRGGVPHSPLPDFYIGAHAALARLELLTRDPRRYASYFPTVKLISP
jgi:predicted nucleic acid-binding protein